MLEFDSLIEPDLYHWEQLLDLLGQQQISDPEFIEALQKLALGSNYAINQLTRYPELIGELQQCTGFELDQDHLTGLLQDVVDPDQIKQQLRRFRHLKLVQIIYLDICREQSVEDTLQQLNDLADLLIRQALDKAEAIVSAKHGQPLDQQGQPMQMNIIGMGKLGGGELNFSSDIDLICTYSEEGQLKGFGQLSHSQFFTNVVKLFKQFLHDSTVDGFVYRPFNSLNSVLGGFRGSLNSLVYCFGCSLSSFCCRLRGFFGGLCDNLFGHLNRVTSRIAGAF